MLISVKKSTIGEAGDCSFCNKLTSIVDRVFVVEIASHQVRACNQCHETLASCMSYIGTRGLNLAADLQQKRGG